MSDKWADFMDAEDKIDAERKWRPISEYKCDGKLVKLFIPETDFSLKDEQGTVTIGFNNQDNDGEDKWCWAGWCWSHDYIRESHDKPTHFKEFDDTPPEGVLI